MSPYTALPARGSVADSPILSHTLPNTPNTLPIAPNILGTFSMMDNPLLAVKGDLRKSVRLSDTTRSSAASSPSLGPASEAPTVEECSVEVDAATAEQTAPATSAADGGDGETTSRAEDPAPQHVRV